MKHFLLGLLIVAFSVVSNQTAAEVEIDKTYCIWSVKKTPHPQFPNNRDKDLDRIFNKCSEKIAVRTLCEGQIARVGRKVGQSSLGHVEAGEFQPGLPLFCKYDVEFIDIAACGMYGREALIPEFTREGWFRCRDRKDRYIGEEFEAWRHWGPMAMDIKRGRFSKNYDLFKYRPLSIVFYHQPRQCRGFG